MLTSRTWHRIFFALLLIFLPTQLGLHFWPDWAMVLGRRVDYLSPTLYLTDILVLLTVGTYVISNQIQKFKKRILFFIPIVLFIILNIFIAANHFVAIYKWAKVLEFGLLGWYIVKTKPAFSFIIYHLSFGILFSSVLAIAQFFFQHSVGGPLWWLGERTFNVDTPGIARFDFFGREYLRAYATFPHPNVLGGFLAVTLPILISNVKFPMSNQKKKFPIFKIITIVLGFIALLLTFSRSAIFIGVVGIVLWKKVKRKSLTTVLIGIVVGFAVLFGIWHLAFGIPQAESLVVRQQLNAAAINMWQQSPLFGVGLGNFLVKLPETLPSRAVYFLQPVHNIYLLVLAETGIVGFLFFAWVLLKIFMRPFGIWHLAFGIFLAVGLIDHYPLTLQQGQLLFAIFLSLNFLNSKRTIGK